jgi:hypothetical protein
MRTWSRIDVDNSTAAQCIKRLKAENFTALSGSGAKGNFRRTLHVNKSVISFPLLILHSSEDWLTAYEQIVTTNED